MYVCMNCAAANSACIRISSFIYIYIYIYMFEIILIFLFESKKNVIIYEIEANNVR